MMDMELSNAWTCPPTSFAENEEKRPKSLEIFTTTRLTKEFSKMSILMMKASHAEYGDKLSENQRPFTWGPTRTEHFPLEFPEKFTTLSIQRVYIAKPKDCTKSRSFKRAIEVNNNVNTTEYPGSGKCQSCTTISQVFSDPEQASIQSVHHHCNSNGLLKEELSSSITTTRTEETDPHAQYYIEPNYDNKSPHFQDANKGYVTKPCPRISGKMLNRDNVDTNHVQNRFVEFQDNRSFVHNGHESDAQVFTDYANNDISTQDKKAALNQLPHDDRNNDLTKVLEETLRLEKLDVSGPNYSFSVVPRKVPGETFESVSDGGSDISSDVSSCVENMVSTLVVDIASREDQHPLIDSYDDFDIDIRQNVSVCLNDILDKLDLDGEVAQTTSQICEDWNHDKKTCYCQDESSKVPKLSVLARRRLENDVPEYPAVFDFRRKRVKSMSSLRDGRYRNDQEDRGFFGVIESINKTDAKRPMSTSDRYNNWYQSLTGRSNPSIDHSPTENDPVNDSSRQNAILVMETKSASLKNENGNKSVLAECANNCVEPQMSKEIIADSSDVKIENRVQKTDQKPASVRDLDLKGNDVENPRTSLVDAIPSSPQLRTLPILLTQTGFLKLPNLSESDDDMSNNGDVFSEEIDKVLEKPSMRRQDSFADRRVLPKASLTAVEFDMDMINGGYMPTNSGNYPRIPSVLREANLYERIHDTVDSKGMLVKGTNFQREHLHVLDNIITGNSLESKRDSALSRGSELSTASSDTIIASEEEYFEKKGSRSSSCGDNYQLSSGYDSTPVAGNDIPKKMRKYHVKEKRPVRSNMQSALAISRYAREESSDTKQNAGNSDNDKVDNRMLIDMNKNTMSSMHIDDKESVKEANIVPDIVDKLGHRLNSLSSSSNSLFSKQSSVQHEDSESSINGSRCSSVTTSPTNSPPLSRHRIEIQQEEPENAEKKIERQAQIAFQWLRAAGFPQYASMYEDGKFPINIQEVGKDHYFLEPDMFNALSRRLDILNKCASLKLNKISPDLQTDEDEEVENCALSDNWRYEENNHRWSRLEFNDPRVSQGHTLENLDEENSNPDVFTSTTPDDLRSTSSSSSGFNGRKFRIMKKDKHQAVDPATAKPKKANFFKRELKKFRSSSFRKRDKDRINLNDLSPGDATAEEKREASLRAMIIGLPQLQSGHEKLEKFHCIPINDATSESQHFNNSMRNRNRKNSSHSITSTSSSSAGGSSAASTPATRAKNIRQHDARNRVNSIDEMSHDVTSPVLASNKQYLSQLAPSRARITSQPNEQKVFYIPRTHTPGTFPSMMVDPSSPSSVPPPNHHYSSSFSSTENNVTTKTVRTTQRSISDNSACKRPVSIYDNMRNSFNPSASAQDLLDMLDPQHEDDSSSGNVELGASQSDSYWTVDHIVHQAELLRKRISIWENDEKRDRGSATYEKSSDQTDSFTSSDTLFDNPPNVGILHDRRISTDSQSSPQPNHNWIEGSLAYLPSISSQPLQLHNLSAGQLMILRRLSMLKLTAMMEKYTAGNNTSNSGSKTPNISWSLPRFIRRVKVLDYKDKSVFGIPLLHNVQRLDQPIPNCILNAMSYLTSTSLDQVGLFRKPGVKSRIQKSREACETNPDMRTFTEWNAYDIADMVKQYFRDLPDPIMTAKLSDTFIAIFLYVPAELRLETLCAALMMLPDENREALRILIWFLKNVAAYSDENQMTESNLAVCFAPSLFYHPHHNSNHNSSFKQIQAPSPRVRKTNKLSSMALGKPDMKDMNNNMASNQCLTYMIKEFKYLFHIPEDAMTQCRLSVMQQTHDVLRSELGYAPNESLGRCSPDKKRAIVADFHTFVDKVTATSVREEIRLGHKTAPGWTQVPSIHGCELSYKKVNDGNYLRMWKCRVEIEGTTPDQIMHRILRERQSWDNKLVHIGLVERPDDRTECLHIERSETAPNLNRDYCILRSWRTNQSHRDITVIVEVSTDHTDAPLQDSTVRGVMLTSRYVIETASPSVWGSDSTSSTSSTGSNGSTQKCYLTHISRVDTKGRNPEWYNKAYGHISMQLLLRIRESFISQNNNNVYINNSIYNTGK